jgi:hypothetical protein
MSKSNNEWDYKNESMCRERIARIRKEAKTNSLSVRLTDEEEDRARAIGRGNACDGIKLAINSFKLINSY